MTTTMTAPPRLPDSAVSVLPARSSHAGLDRDPIRPELAEWLQPRRLTTGRRGEPMYAMPTARRGDHVAAAICQPGRPDGEVATGLWRTR